MTTTCEPGSVVLIIDHTRVRSAPWRCMQALRDFLWRRAGERPEINTLRTIEGGRMLSDEVVDWSDDWYKTDGKVVEVLI